MFTAFASVPNLGNIASNQFRPTTTGAAVAVTDRILYNTTTGVLTYDSNGSAAGGATQFAILENKPSITYLEFVII